MNAERLKYKEITDSILRSFYEVYNEPSDGLYMIIREKISVMIRVDRRLSSYNIGINSMVSNPDMYKNMELSCVYMVKDRLKGLYKSLLIIV
jgi:hypothetical protein